MDENYSSKYSGEQVDAAVEYFLNHSQTEADNSYEYTNTVYCESSSFPSQPFKNSSLPKAMPTNFPFTGENDGKYWYDTPNTSSKNWYQCVLKINFKSKNVVSQGSVMDMTGATGRDGANGQNGQDGVSGQDGNDGSNGNYTEFRYRRLSQYAISLTYTQKTARAPSGWSSNWNTADVEDYSTLQTTLATAFDSWLYNSYSTASGSSGSNYTDYFTDISGTVTYDAINAMFAQKHNIYLNASDTQKTTILEAYEEFKDIYDECASQEKTALEVNTEYHKAYTDYIDSSHFWVLFMIYAVIDGDTDSLIGEWSIPQRIQGEDGKAGPSGSNGISGIPGVSIGVAFTTGTKYSYRPEAANPANYPYNTIYTALFGTATDTTRWQKTPPTVTDTYPYIWFTQCRYIVSKDANGNDIYKFEDAWSVPQRYTGLNGITTVETVYVKNPIIYPAGIFDATKTYQNTGTTAPYVYFDGYYYYMSGQGTYIGSDTSNPSNSSQYWTKMESFEAIFAKVGIIANGLIGSAVFNGDYMFSQMGLAYDGTEVTSYEKFLTHYNTGAALTNPYDDNAAFKPYICINFATGEFWSNSVNVKVASTASGISIQMKEDVINQIQAAGVDISSGKVKVTGEFEGTSNGTFKGDVTAKSFSVVDDNGQKTLEFTTYNSETMGSPSDGSTISNGTPIMIVNYLGEQYVASMVKLATGSGTTLNYIENSMTTSDMNFTTSVGKTMGTLGSTYYCITKAPYLTVRNVSTDTGRTITAILRDSSGNKVSWSTVYNKYYSGSCPVIRDTNNTNINNGVLAYKISGSFVSSFFGYLGTPVNKYLTMCNSGFYYGKTVKAYQKCSITNGVLSKLAYYVLVGYSYTIREIPFSSSSPIL